MASMKVATSFMNAHKGKGFDAEILALRRAKIILLKESIVL